MSDDKLSTGSVPDYVVEALVADAFDRAKGRATGGGFRRRRISDRVFDSIEFARGALTELSAQKHQDDAWLETDISVPVDVVEDQATTHILLSPVAAVSLATAAHMALDWKTIARDKETDALRNTVHRLLMEMRASPTTEELMENHPHWTGIFRVLVADVMHGGENMKLIRDGIDEELLENKSDFTVEARSDPSEQIEMIAAGIVLRLAELCSAERQDVTEMEGWENWMSEIEPAQLKDIPRYLEIYDDVRIQPRLLLGLLSPMDSVRRATISAIQNQGGFLHAADAPQLSEMIQYGVTGVIPDHAYYGVLTDPNHIEKHMADLCGYEPGKHYNTVDDLPTQSKIGWPLHWLNRGYALEMFRHVDQVALTVELAVRKKPEAKEGKKAAMRRKSGVAAALKYDVYQRVPQPMILTRHFEILEVNDQPVPPVENYGSMRFIQALGGHYIGSAEETFEIPASTDGAQPTKLKVFWHLNLAERRVSLEEIEKRRKKVPVDK